MKGSSALFRPGFRAGSVVAAAMILSGSLRGAIMYGDFSDVPPGSVMYTDVTESSFSPDDTEPLFGAPNLKGNRLDFNPKRFASTALSGASDITDGHLSFTLATIPSQSLEVVTLSGRGDATLFGSGVAAQVGFALSVGSITVLEVDGSPLATPVSLGSGSASGVFTIADNQGQLMPWSLNLVYDVDAALSQASVPFVYGATKLEISIDNSFATISDPTSIAFIAQKDFVVDTKTEPFSAIPIPEPSSLVLLSFMVLLLGPRNRS